MYGPGQSKEKAEVNSIQILSSGAVDSGESLVVSCERWYKPGILACMRLGKKVTGQPGQLSVTLCQKIQ